MLEYAILYSYCFTGMLADTNTDLITVHKAGCDCLELRN